MFPENTFNLVKDFNIFQKEIDPIMPRGLLRAFFPF
jgi:hypothetical protein